MAPIANNTIFLNYLVYLKVAKRVGLKGPHHTQKMEQCDDGREMDFSWGSFHNIHKE